MTRLTLAPTVPGIVKVDRFGIEVDGMPFPWAVVEGSVSATVEGPLANVTLTILAERVVMGEDDPPSRLAAVLDGPRLG